MSARHKTTSTVLTLGLLVLLGCGGGGDGGGGDDGGCGSEWNTQVVLTFTGPAGCPPAGYEEVLCARFWGAESDTFILEVNVTSPGCAEDTVLHFRGAISSGGSMAGIDDQTEYRDCLLNALAPGATVMMLENMGGERLADSFTFDGDWRVFPDDCTGTFTIQGSLP